MWAEFLSICTRHHAEPECWQGNREWDVWCCGHRASWESSAKNHWAHACVTTNSPQCTQANRVGNAVKCWSRVVSPKLQRQRLEMPYCSFRKSGCDVTEMDQCILRLGIHPQNGLSSFPSYPQSEDMLVYVTV